MNFNGRQIKTERIFLHRIVKALNRCKTYVHLLNTIILAIAGLAFLLCKFSHCELHGISPSISHPSIARHFVSICSHHGYLFLLSAHSACPDLTCRLAVIFSWTVTDDIRLLLALKRWKVELMGFQMPYCERRLSREER